ncbi:DNA adenine methylase [Methylovulum psychrotolerans]|uniref:site-specific DNA-methyltransferase (adenine-specific) n=1 Tax=Methylovulum psychrotolerans TaxID=1704499 RepID=A0A2S5CKH1_9GAMM|nr:DNA adenine methylase [Methylovulum psychrotolerans]POZ51315.1 restriction endonuclease subunit M [Methylovulum psychrotolerans]
MLRWQGGKSKLAKIIIPSLPKHVCYVEPFCGGAAIMLRKPRSKAEVINDANGELINLYRCVQCHPEELAKQSVAMLHSRFLFDRLKDSVADRLIDIQRAARFYALNRMAFSASMSKLNFGYARTASAGLSAKRFMRDIESLAARLDGVFIEHLDWAACIARYDSKDTLVYCDPPYYQTAGYGIEFGIEQYTKMAKIAETMQGKMIISVNDIPAMRDIFAGLVIEQLPIKYSCGKIQSGQSRAQSFELLIRNF